MGDIGPQPSQTQLTGQSFSPSEADEVSVLVTGFGVSYSIPTGRSPDEQLNRNLTWG